MKTDCPACGAMPRRAHATDCPNKRIPLREQVGAALAFGPQTMPGLVTALERPQATVQNVLFAMVRDGKVRSAKAPTSQGRDRVYWLSRSPR